jgi:hypothetical protein
MTRAATFKQGDVRRAMQAVESGGRCVESVEFFPGGSFRVLTRAPGEAAVQQDNQDWTDLAGAPEVSRA